ncbi:hypothetical protein MCAP1_001747 [Malassezia caprae]|uniref:Uncharacterized protein n=1 Tax=Malassezia caprae TaxID=1381934 RepID=A0AAF0E688_9BASI|nr:hypothetical protein MCAP1_001747 [Malassezia caprae]
MRMHAFLFPTRAIPKRMHHRLVYLLLKRAERIDVFVPEVDRVAERRRQAEQLLHVANDPCALDGDLLGRLVFRLARLQAVDRLGPVLLRYSACTDKPANPVAAGQPFSAVISEALEWYRLTKKPEALHLSWEALHSAFTQQLPIKHVLVQQLLACSGPAYTRLCIPHAPRTLDAPDALASLIIDTCRLRPRYMHHRAAVVLCKTSDPRAALQLLDTHDADIPFDVYAATITALTWMARARIIPDTALFLAWSVMDAMQQAGMEADEQMYGEWIRALQVVQNECMAPHTLSVSGAVVQALRDLAPASVPSWTSYVSSLTQQIFARQGDRVLRWEHLVLLFHLHVRLRHFSTCQSLYEYARESHPDSLPFHSASTFAWLLSQACQYHGDMRWAVRLYHDWLAAGRALPESQVEPFLRACLSHGMPSMVRVVVRDACEMEVIPRPTLASHVARALFLEGHLEAGLAFLADLHTDAPSTTPRDESLPPALPPLAMYAIGLYEASCAGFGTKQDDRERLFHLFDEFRLVLAHAYVKEDVPGIVMDLAYYGAIRLHLQALGQEASSGPSDLVGTDKDACVASLRDAWTEWQDLAGLQCGTTFSATEFHSLVHSIRTYIPDVPRPSAMTIDMEQ